MKADILTLQFMNKQLSSDKKIQSNNLILSYTN